MKREIDFLKAYEQKTESTANIIRFLSKGLILFAVVYCICTAGVFVYWSLLSKNLNEINNKIELKKNEIRSQQKKESLYFLLKNQLSFLSKVFSGTQENYSQIFSSVFQLAGDDVEISQLKISANGETMISAMTSSAFSLADFLDRVTDDKDMGSFSKITLNSLTREKEGNYSFSLSFSHDKDRR
jgi:hypothetical protein